MPQAIPLVAGYVTTGAVAAAGAYAWASALIGAVVTYGLTKASGLDRKPKLLDPGISANVSGTVEPIPILYGRRRVGGVLAQLTVTGEIVSNIFLTSLLNALDVYELDPRTDNKFLNFVICWCEGEVDGIEILYFNEEKSTKSVFTDFFIAEEFKGSDTQNASALFLASLANTYGSVTADRFWSVDHKLRGVAYSYVRLKYDATIWAGGIPVITCKMNGIKYRNIRSVTPDTRVFGDNPALIIYDYLTNASFGRGMSPDDIDTQSFIDAANYCDQIISFPITGGPNPEKSQPRYRCDALLSPEDTCLDNLRSLLSSCNGILIFSGGKYRLKIDKPEPLTFVINESNVVGGWTILLESNGSRLNRVTAQFPNRINEYQEDKVIVDSEELLANDQGVLLEATISLPTVTDKYQAKQMAELFLLKSRYSMQVGVTVSLAGLSCEVFDVVSVTHPLTGWVSKLFRVLSIELHSQETVTLRLQEYSDAAYVLSPQTYEDSPYPLATPDPRYAGEIFDFSYQAKFDLRADGSTRSYIKTQWSVPFNSTNLLSFEIQVARDGTPEVAITQVPFVYAGIDPSTPSVHHFEFDTLQATLYTIQIRAVNRLGALGPKFVAPLASYAGTGIPLRPVSLRVSGYATPNGNLLRWVTTTPIDVEVWYSNTSSAFSSASLYQTVPYDNYAVPAPIGVVGYYWIRSKSGSGVYSQFLPDQNEPGIARLSGLRSYAADALAGQGGVLRDEFYFNTTLGIQKAKL